MEQTGDKRIVAAVEYSTFPYPPSWVDRLMAWVALRPGPAWLYYFGAAALFYIEAPPRRVAELEYRLTTMPPHMVWLMTLLGLLEGGLTIAGILSSTLVYPGPPAFASLPAAVLEVAIVLLIGVFFVIAVYHTVHQLRVVSIIYTELTKVDLFKQGPLHAFARLAGLSVHGGGVGRDYLYVAAAWDSPAAGG